MPRTQSWPFKEDITPDDPEFEAKVRAQSFKDLHPSIRREDAAHVKTRAPLTLKGFYSQDGTDYLGLAQELVPFVEGALPDMEPNRVYGVGPDGATAQTWAHEFRHKGNPDMTEDGIRVQDAYMAGSRRQWDEAVRSWQNRRGYSSSDVAARDLITILRQREKHLVERNGAPEPTLLQSMFGRADPLYAPYRHWVDED